jgi:hypothetical protein
MAQLRGREEPCQDATGVEGTMSIPKNTISVEMMLAGWQQTHSGGTKLVFWIADEDLEHFKHLTVKKGGTAGQRFMAALVEVGDDDQPKDRDKPHDPLRMSAVMLCKNTDFQQFCADSDPGDVPYMPHEDQAAESLRAFCGIESRRELDHNPKAAESFARMMSLYRDWRKERGLD